ncbi:HAD family hydrolase [Actinomadura algeriensis]|uniref:Hydrolase of the HAD superfamily n=1 Tax=Actinomadura algeriensis TaxID=1679523 RepID=A0ABR9JID9_9ACTN|nr:HAD family hydrolase [Actinomadura algeriensis]MBE1530176.1 putative hydrolase of the HAD superfamily [Actinomadura algeriensis]
MIAAALFDLDGTLLDHDGAAGAAIAGAFPDADAAWLVPRWHELGEAAIERYLAGELDFTEQRRARIVPLARELGLGSWDAARADAWFAGYTGLYEAEWRPYPDVPGALAALAERGLPLGVITNGDVRQQRSKLDRIGLAERLPHVTASSEVGCAKPAAEIFHAACTALGLPPDAVAYVGDRLVTDARGAAAAGMTGVWLDRSGGPAPDTPDIVRLTSLDALPGLLARDPRGSGGAARTTA